MRLIKSEFLKLFLNKTFVICLVISLLVNSLFLVIAQSSDMESLAIIESKIAYEQLITECNSAPDKQEFIESKRIGVQIGYIIMRKGAQSEAALSYKEKNPAEFEEALKLNLTDNALNNYSLMIEEIASQIDYIDSFDEFILNMSDRAKSQSSFSIFAKPNSFAYKNIEKTPLDFEAVKDASLVLGNNKVLEVSTTCEVTDYILLLLILLIAIVLFSLEREKGLYNLVHSTENGRFETIGSKLIVTVFLTALISIVFYTINILLCGALFGFGDLSRAVQSSDMFMNCTLNISFLEYLCIWILGKTLLLCAISLIMSFLFVLLKSPSITYIDVAVLLSFEFGAFLFVNGNSTMGALKYINIFYLLGGNNIFGVYLNVNIFSLPVNITTVFFIFILVLSLVGTLGSIFAFSKLNMEKGKLAIFEKLKNKINKKRKIKGSVSIYKAEAFKHYKTSFAIIPILLLMLLFYQGINDDLSIIFRGPQESAYNTYMQDLEGELEDDKESIIKSEQAYFDSLNAKITEISNDTTMSEDDKNAEIMSIQNILDTKGAAFEDILSQIEYAKNKSEVIEKPVSLLNEVVNKRLTEDTFREWQCFTLLLACVVFCTSNILSCEYKKNTANLISATRFGKSRLLLTKLFTVFATTVISFVLVYLPYMINFVNTFGSSSFDIPLAYSRDFSSLTSDITVLQYILTLGALHFLVAITATAFTYMLSYLLKSQFTTMIISSGVIIIPCVLFISNPNVRSVAAFQNDTQATFVVVTSIICILTLLISIVTVFIKFNHIKWRVKNG